jgi:DNA primase
MAISSLQLTPQFVQAVRDAVDILGIASDYTKPKKAGRRYTALCPIHKERTPSFSIDPEQGLFHCFGCGVGGDAIKLHMLLTGDDFAAAMESLARRYGISLPPPTSTRSGGQREERDLEAVLEAAQQFFREQLGASSTARRYLARRRISEDLAERFGLGFAPDDWRRLSQALHPRFSMRDLESAGLLSRPESGGEAYDRFRNRLMFPIRNASGRLLGFGGRTLGDDKAKYINTAETERFHKGHLLYGLDRSKRAVRESGKALLVEGYFDVLASVEAGVEFTVASMGTALTPEQARMLARYADEVTVGYDADEAGENASRRALSLLLAEGLGVRRARFGAGQDPDSLRQEKGPEAVKKAVDEAPDFVTLEIDRLIPPEVARNPRVRARSANAIAELLQPMRDAILRFGYGRLAADRLGVPVDLLWKRLGVDREELLRSAEAKPQPRVHRVVRSLEERALQLLLGPASPEKGELTVLPPAEAFLDEEVRNFYTAFLRLYAHAGAGGRLPQAKEVLAEYAGQGGSLDRVAGLLLEEPDSGRPGELAESLKQLQRRFAQQRLRHLTREIQEAQRVDDTARLQTLLDEKTRLSRELHIPARDVPGQT